MKIQMNKRSGFTLVELIMVIVILGILAVVAFPQYFNMAAQSNVAAEAGVVGGVRAGIHTFMANSPTHTFPTAAGIDAVANGTDCAVATPCFGGVLAQGGVTTGPANGGWRKVTATTWSGPTTTVYTYTPGTGAFQ